MKNNLIPEAISLSERLPHEIERFLARSSFREQGLIGQNTFDFSRPRDSGESNLVVSAPAVPALHAIWIPISPHGGCEGSVSLLGSLSRQVGISAYVPTPFARTEIKKQRSKVYVRHGILIHHTGQKITSEDVANALSEE